MLGGCGFAVCAVSDICPSRAMVHFKVCPMHGIRMRLAAMYSGGKDSTFAMYLAEQMGHEIVCLVTVRPEDRASWIFHTPNLSAVPAMAEAMGMELVTAVSDGTEEGDMAAMRDVLSDGQAVKKEELLTKTNHALGFLVKGRQIRLTLELVLKAGISNGTFVHNRRGGTIRLR